MAVSRSRKLAYDVLLRVEAEDAYASDLLHSRLDDAIQPADAALATEIAMGVLRWRRLLDFLLERHLKKKLERLDLPVAIALRMALYQVRFLSRIPVRAAVHESVELVKKARKTSAATLVNAVLRRAVSETSVSAGHLVPAELGRAERLSILHSHPTWMVERWLARFGEERTIPLLEANNRAPRLTCAVHDNSQRGSIIHELEGEGLRVEPGMLLRNAFAVSGGSVTRTKAFRMGRISIQDEASQAVTLLLGVKAGNKVLDICAAPGGKAAMLIRTAGNKGLVVAADVHAHRVKAMRAQFERIGHKTAHVLTLDAAQALPFATQFDRVLADAPCSGTGTLARHPEIRWRLRPKQLAEFHKLQASILQNVAAKLAPGGTLVYSTCSLEPEENENVADDFAKCNAGFQAVKNQDLARELKPYLSSAVEPDSLFDGDNQFRTSPATHKTDGFFGAAFKKVQ
jgi:16S rRNA (cytosine967-C5)-methyltransferase